MSKFNEIYKEAIGDPSLNYTTDVNNLKKPQAEEAKEAIRKLTYDAKDPVSIFSAMADKNHPINYENLPSEQKKIIDDAFKTAKIVPQQTTPTQQPVPKTQDNQQKQGVQQNTASNQQPSSSYQNPQLQGGQLQGLGTK